MRIRACIRVHAQANVRILACCSCPCECHLSTHTCRCVRSSAHWLSHRLLLRVVKSRVLRGFGKRPTLQVRNLLHPHRTMHLSCDFRLPFPLLLHPSRTCHRLRSGCCFHRPSRQPPSQSAYKCRDVRCCWLQSRSKLISALSLQGELRLRRHEQRDFLAAPGSAGLCLKD